MTPLEDGTIKEMLRLMEKNADERHAVMREDIGELKEDITDLKSRTGQLEIARAERFAVTQLGGKALGASAALAMLIVNVAAVIIATGRLP